MKISTGNYYNIYSEAGYDNYGLKVKFDIMIIFVESFGISSDISDTLDLMIEGALRGLAMSKPYAKKNEVKQTIEQVLKTLEYEYEKIIVDQAVTLEGLKNTD